MSVQSEFDQALKDVKGLSSLSNQDLLALYALFKQATNGDVSGKKPGMLDLKGRAKFEAWEKQKGKSTDAAMKEYVGLVKKLQQA